MDKNITVEPNDLLRFVKSVFSKAGLKENDASILADTLVTADLRGVGSHGVIRIPSYLQYINDREMNIDADPKIVKDHQGVALIDGEYGMGQPSAYHAMEIAIEKAKRLGIGAVGVKHTNHFGAAAYYANMAAEENLIGIVFTSVLPLMPAPGGVESVVGNNPIGIAIPSKNYRPIILDMATSNGPFGKIMMAAKKGEAIPEGWALNLDGEMTTDANSALEALTLLPVGGPKGFGLSVAIEVLTGVLINSVFSIYRDSDYPRECGHFMIAVNIESFSEVDTFKKNADLLIDAIKNSKSKSNQKPMYPGEPEHLVEKERRESGIPLPLQVYEDLFEISKRNNIEMFKVK